MFYCCIFVWNLKIYNMKKKYFRIVRDNHTIDYLPYYRLEESIQYKGEHLLWVARLTTSSMDKAENYIKYLQENEEDVIKEYN